MKKLIRELLMGRPAIGIPVSSIKGSTHTCYPDVQIPATKMHEVLAQAIREVQQKIKES